ncbi:MAG: hypothetical protein Q8K99_05960 [Actinomycetota bacterium]|nr:hypothetical protein [Actinomycetota bacterium]
MLKRSIELIRDGEPQVLLTWHKPDGEGGTIPIAMEFSDAVDEETRQRIIHVCERPINVLENGRPTKALSGSSRHFLNLPKLLARLGFRVRVC